MSNDFTSTLVLNLQQRVVCMENSIGFLTREVHRLSQLAPHASQGFQTTIPLQPISHGRRPYLPQQEPSPRAPLISQTHSQTHSQAHSQAHSQQQEDAQPVTLSDILTNGEVVTFGIHTGRDASGGMTTSLLTTTFDGTNCLPTTASVRVALRPTPRGVARRAARVSHSQRRRWQHSSGADS